MKSKIESIERKQEVPHEGAFCDLLWSDPDGMLLNSCLKKKGIADAKKKKKKKKRKHRGMDPRKSRSKLLLRGSDRAFLLLQKQDRLHLPVASARDGGFQEIFQQQAHQRLVGSKLLLQVRQRRLHPRARRKSQRKLQGFRAGSRERIRRSH